MCSQSRAGLLPHAMNGRNSSTVGQLLRRRGLTLATAESCTGGLIGHRITQVPGCSDYFLGGAITYSNGAKTALLGVSRSTLRKHGAVSRQTAAEMAQGARRIFRADLAVSATGIAGPTGGSAAKPVGLVFIGLAHEDGIRVRKYIFKGPRGKVTSQAADAALAMLREHLDRRRQGAVAVTRRRVR